jgi:hypothetical protein
MTYGWFPSSSPSRGSNRSTNTGANKDRIAHLLETLSSLGKARQLDDGRYVPV